MDQQQIVDSIADPLRRAESTLMEAMVAHENIMAAMRNAAEELAIHRMKAPFGDVAQAIGAMGKAWDQIIAAHRSLEQLRRDRKMPDPGPVIYSGAGGGK